MKRRGLKVFSIFLTLLFSPFFSLAQINVDSLKRVWNDASQSDQIRMNALYDLAWDGFLFSNPDSSFYYATLLYEFAKEKKDIKNMSNALNTQGASYYIKGNYENAIDYYNRNILLLKKNKNESDLADAYNNIGILYDEQGDYVRAIEQYSKSLKIQEKLKKPGGIAIALNNIGNIYFSQEEFELAIQYYNRSIRYYQKLKNQKGIAGAYNNLANVYKSQEKFDSSLLFQEKALKIYNQVNHLIGISGSYNNIGMIYVLKKEYEVAENYFRQALQISEKAEDKTGLANTLNNLSKIYLIYIEKQIKNKNEALPIAMKYADRALACANETGNVLERKNVSQTLAKLYKIKQNYKMAFEMQELYYLLKDSLVNEENQKAVLKQKYKYDYEKRVTADSVKNAEAKKVLDAQLQAREAESKQHQSEAKNQRQRTYFLLAGLGLTFIFVLLILSRYRHTQKQKKIIEQQKHQVDEAYDQLEEKQKEITDSINYAKRLQQAILAEPEEIKQYLPESFLFYKPKDIVAGDFYFFEKTDDYFFYAAADCTGHGVPGAMVSVVCSNALTRCVKEFKLIEPGKILDEARKIVMETFDKSGLDVKDGMDISLVKFQVINNQITNLTWAGANNPIWYIQNGMMHEIKADKQAIGKTDKPQPFTTHEISVGKGDTVFLFTDGYADQFGGEKGKKFKYANLQKILLENAGEKPEIQYSKLEIAFDDWKGKQEQVDDVTIIGFRV